MRQTLWRWARRVVVVAAVSATFVALFYAIENRRGRSAWAKAQAEARAAGFPLLPSEVMPVREPEAVALTATPELSVFFAEAAQASVEHRRAWMGQTPFSRVLKPSANGASSNDSQILDAYVWESQGLRSLAEWRARLGVQDLSEHLALIDAELEALAAASRRAHYFGPVSESGEIEWAKFAFRYAGQALVLRARVRLEVGEASGAAEDLATALRLAGIFSHDGSMIGPTFGGQIAGWATQALRESLPARRWSNAELKQLAEAAARVDVFKGARDAARMEVVLKVWGMQRFVERSEAAAEYFRDSAEGVPFEFFPSEWWPLSARGQWFAGSPESGAEANRRLWAKFGPERGLALMPSGWWLQVTATVLREDRAMLERIFDDEARRMPDPAALFRADAYRSEGGWTPYRSIEYYMAMRGYTLQNEVYFQVEIDLLRVALELERWRARHGVYPSDLGELATAGFIAPRDLLSGESLRYSTRTDDADSMGFELYSVGGNGRDDGGIAGREGERSRLQALDWVW